MTTSESIKEINTALVKFHTVVGKIKKDSTNPFFKSKYSSLSEILESIDEPLTSNGLAVVQFPEGENSLTTRVLHTSGEWMEATYVMLPVKNTPQDRGSCLTYMRRYAIGAILSLNISDDDDGNSASGRTNGSAQNLPQNVAKPTISERERENLLGLLETSTYEEKTRKGLKVRILAINNKADFATAQTELLNHQVESQNMSQAEINSKLKFAAAK